MISQRVRGFYNLFVRIQILLVLAYYWIHFGVYTAIYSKVTAPEPYAVYCVLIFLGLLIEAFQRDDASWLHKNLVAKHRIALRQTIFAAVFVEIYLRATKDFNISRVFLFSLLPMLYLLLLLTSWLLPPQLARLLFREQRAERTLLIGSSQKAAALKLWLQRKAAFGFNTLGVICDEALESVAGFPVVGGTSDWERVVKEKNISQILLLESPLFSQLIKQMTSTCERLGVRLLVLSDLDEKFGYPITYMEDDGFHFFGLRSEPLENPVNRAMKRVVDLAVALPVVLLILPLTSVLVWLLQLWQSPGPLLYVQNRTGLQNRPFEIIKYRTMQINNPDVARQASANDDRIFPAGRWLRKFSIDEVPQFWNVLRGEMSVVGPRPHLAEHDEQFARVMRNYYVRGFVKPGITGLAQVRGFRGEANDEGKLRKRIESDIDYLENWSLSLDLVIILRTVWQMMSPPKTAI